jgi:hypothetical protein
MRKTFCRLVIDWRQVAERRDALLSMVVAIAEMKGDGQMRPSGDLGDDQQRMHKGIFRQRESW